MEPLYLPPLKYFSNANRFSGSYNGMRFMITPQVAKDGRKVVLEDSTLFGQIWHGLFCIEKSTVEVEETFPMSQDGMKSLEQWLLDHEVLEK